MSQRESPPAGQGISVLVSIFRSKATSIFYNVCVRIVWWEGLRTAELLLPFPDFILLQLQNRPVYKNSNLLLSVWSMFWKKNPNNLKTTWLYYVNQKYFVRFRQQKQIKLKLKKRLWFGLKHFIFINSNPAHREWPITVTHNPVQNTHQRTLWIQCLK